MARRRKKLPVCTGRADELHLLIERLLYALVIVNITRKEVAKNGGAFTMQIMCENRYACTIQNIGIILRF